MILGAFGSQIAAVLGALIVGLSLGLLGSGGSILTVPLLVYLVGHTEKASIAESLAIVGMISGAGALRRLPRREIVTSALLTFGIASMVGTFVGAAFAESVSGVAQILLLGCIMVAAATLMFRPPRLEGKPHAPHPALLPLGGLGVGFLTGLVGIGGGFMIVPSLVLIGGLEMLPAVATSLALIFLNCVVGFAKYFHTAAGDSTLRIDWGTIALFGLVGIFGGEIGRHLSTRMNQAILRKIFAVFVLVMGIWIVSREWGKLASQ
ncbi:MAG: sulfite exporter TauE/SafE family protein [Phycisphaerae bacterium]